jgi:hypothetical protein
MSIPLFLPLEGYSLHTSLVPWLVSSHSGSGLGHLTLANGTVAHDTSRIMQKWCVFVFGLLDLRLGNLLEDENHMAQT